MRLIDLFHVCNLFLFKRICKALRIITAPFIYICRYSAICEIIVVSLIFGIVVGSNLTNVKYNKNSRCIATTPPRTL